MAIFCYLHSSSDTLVNLHSDESTCKTGIFSIAVLPYLAFSDGQRHFEHFSLVSTSYS